MNCEAGNDLMVSKAKTGIANDLAAPNRESIFAEYSFLKVFS